MEVATTGRRAGFWGPVSARYWEIRCYLTRFRPDHIRARWHEDDFDWVLAHLRGGPVPVPKNCYLPVEDDDDPFGPPDFLTDVEAELVEAALAEAWWN